ncbi:unnamed protein product [Adineta steineri]|uniref:TRAF-type domain-containing protein n=2 Tax=Adineta steineri TaxID=433720 RepID=A0A819LFS7_9BILA|nr:unnamed protein product [Adineta steineri]
MSDTESDELTNDTSVDTISTCNIYKSFIRCSKCTWLGYCDQLSDHWKTCAYTTRPPRVKKKKSRKKQLSIQVKPEYTQCTQCGNTTIEISDLEYHMRGECPKTHILCKAVSNKCTWSGCRDELSDHLKTCAYTIRPSPVEEITFCDEEISIQAKPDDTGCKQCGNTTIKTKALKYHMRAECPKTPILCPAVSNQCTWSGYRDELNDHLKTCAYKIRRPRVIEIISRNEHLSTQVDQYKDRIKKLEIEAVEANKIITRLQEQCNEYEDRIKQLINESKGLVPYRNVELQDFIEKCQLRLTVDLRSRRLNDRDMEIVVDEAMNKKQCKRLLLDQNKISFEGASIIAAGLKDNTTLETLNLEKNSIGDKGVKSLSNVLLTKNSSLQRLDINENNITNIGAQYLAELLKITTNLIWLGLHTNDIGDQGIELLANTLAYDNRHLQVLDLCFNKSVTDRSVESIITMVKHNRSLKRFHMYGCNLSESGRDRIRQEAKSNTILQLLEI